MDRPEDQPEFDLRRMVEADLPSVLAIERASYPSPWSETAFLGEIRGTQASHPLVAVTRPGPSTTGDGTHVVGFLCCWIVRDLMQINNIAVHASYRRKGLGRLLLSSGLEEGRKRGVTSCFLDVRPSNLPARALYGSFGFFEIGLRKGYYSDTKEDAIVMRLDFPAIGNPSEEGS